MRSILGAAIDEEADITLVDMEAGLEHLSRSGGTLAHADVLLVVMEPSRKSILTAGRTIVLAEELGLDRVYGIGNKARPDDDEFFRSVAAEYRVPLAGIVPENDEVAECDRQGSILAADRGQPVRDAVNRIVTFVDEALAADGFTNGSGRKSNGAAS